MSLRWCESPGNAARIAPLSADQAPTAIIGCPDMTVPFRFVVASLRNRKALPWKVRHVFLCKCQNSSLPGPSELALV
jgi:hypothetical protein